jgi:cytochrome P450
VDGEPIEEARVVEMIFLILAGGVDTTTALIAQGIKYLDEHPEDRRRLIDDPSLIANACEEFLRYYTPTQNLARTVTADVEIGGRAMCPGERVLMSWASINHDPAMFDRPNEVIIDRFPNRHAAFGLGAHRCLGSNFTRVEFRIMLEEVLKRMPDYALDPTGTEPYENIGIVNGFRHMAATFTPGTRLGSKLHL